MYRTYIFSLSLSVYIYIFLCGLSSFSITYPADLFIFYGFFYILFITATASNRVFYIFALTSMLNSSLFLSCWFTNIRFLYLTSFSLLTSLKFQSNFGTHSTMVWFYLINFHTSYITNSLAMFLSIQIWTTCLHSLLSGDIQVTFWMSLCWYHVPVTAKSLPSAKFRICFPLWFISLWRLCPPHAGHTIV
jgi:hypothetical protein